MGSSSRNNTNNKNDNNLVVKTFKNRKNSSQTRKRVKLYNNNKLSIDQRNSLVICDWDDTLFPTSWVNNENIDLTDLRSRYKYTRYFDRLDNHLYDTIRRIKNYSDLMIITNATHQWVMITLTVLPKTKKILSDVPIVSARESFQKQCGVQEWKKYTFRAELSKEGRTHYKNIVSIGDAHYEHNALIGLYKWDIIPHKYLKSVKFTRSKKYDDLFGQIQLIGEEIKNIVIAQRHLDLTLDIINHDE